MITFEEYLLSTKLNNDPALCEILESIAKGCIEIHEKVQRVSIDDYSGSTGEINIQGEEVQKLDEFGNEIIVERLKSIGKVAIVGGEELEIPIIIGDDKSPYMVNMDPVDGSSNIDVGISIGSIFGIWPRNFEASLNEKSLLIPGRQQTAAVYVVYGSSTIMMVATVTGVQCFTLDLIKGSFVLTHPNIEIPKKCNYYSVNYGNWTNFSEKIQSILIELQNNYSLRYVGSLVADFHRNLLKGGVFLYPEDKKNLNGKLRLMYEANPLAFITEKAGGIAISGENNILDIIPSSLHQRTPLILGNKDILKSLFL